MVIYGVKKVAVRGVVADFASRETSIFVFTREK